MNQSVLRMVLALAATNAVASFAVGSETKSSAERQSKPNILIGITDEQGCGDLTSRANPYTSTPNLDKLLAVTSAGQVSAGKYDVEARLIDPDRRVYPACYVHV